jgi:phosphate transport system protein
MAVVSGAHTIKKFDEELATLRDLVLRMGGLVEEQLLRAVESIERADPELARSVLLRDRDIDRIELKADEEIAQLLALRSPMGVDLRTVLTYSKTVNDLERIGDEVKKIARLAVQLQEDPRQGESLSLGDEIGSMARHAQDMLHRALDSLVRLDLDQARRVKDLDKGLDRDFDAGIARVRGLMAADAQSIPLALELAFALKALERVGDHAKNISEYVFYLVEGRDVRHPKVER